ncbi:MAG: VWA domain-containing protein [Bryobacteraceae bacterium]
MNRLRTKLIFMFVAATIAPLALTVWITFALLRQSLDLAPLRELDEVSKSLEKVGREYYQDSRDALKAQADAGRVRGQTFAAGSDAPSAVVEFRESTESQRFVLGGENGDRLDYLVRRGSDVIVYSRPLGAPMRDVQKQYTRARGVLESSRQRDLPRGFNSAFLLLAGSLWAASLAAMIYLANRLSRPVRQLTRGLAAVAQGDLSARVADSGASDEVAAAVRAFNHMADQLQHARERLIHVTRLASWQALARKMAHEVKNSLTPIRLTMEEIASRGATFASTPGDKAFLEQAGQIVVDEVTTLERRVRAFSDFASEPPVMPDRIEVNALVEERVALLRSAHPEVVYELRMAAERPGATADPDLLKGILTNLLENAAHAARAGGVVLAATRMLNGKACVEVHDSGPGLSAQARSTLFEPTISFKKGGMGLGLSIARRSALMCGGDLTVIDGELGGAAFRISLPLAQEEAAAPEMNVAEERPGAKTAKAARIVATIAMMLVLVPSANAQTTEESGPTFKVKVPLVVAPAIVVDKKGKLIDGLKVTDFRLLDNGVEQKITDDVAWQPISLVVAVETSSNLRWAVNKISRIGSMLDALVAGKDGDAAVINYNDEVRVVQPFTHDFNKINAALEMTKLGDNKARVSDAVAKAVSLLEERPVERRRVILIIGETRDRGSETKLEDAAQRAQAANIMVYTIAVNHAATAFQGFKTNPQVEVMKYGGSAVPPMDLLAPFREAFRALQGPRADPFEALARLTGGRREAFAKRTSLEDAITRIGEEIHSQYMISYTPAQGTQGFHEIRLEVARPDAIVRTRAGYWLGQ